MPNGLHMRSRCVPSFPEAYPASFASRRSPVRSLYAPLIRGGSSSVSPLAMLNSGNSAQSFDVICAHLPIEPAAGVRGRCRPCESGGPRARKSTTARSSTVVVWKLLIATSSSSSATWGRRPSRLPTAFQRSTSRASFEPSLFDRVGPRSRDALRRPPTPRSTCSRPAEPKRSASTRTLSTPRNDTRAAGSPRREHPDLPILVAACRSFEADIDRPSSVHQLEELRRELGMAALSSRRPNRTPVSRRCLT